MVKLGRYINALEGNSQWSPKPRPQMTFWRSYHWTNLVTTSTCAVDLSFLNTILVLWVCQCEIESNFLPCHLHIYGNRAWWRPVTGCQSVHPRVSCIWCFIQCHYPMTVLIIWCIHAFMHKCAMHGYSYINAECMNVPFMHWRIHAPQCMVLMRASMHSCTMHCAWIHANFIHAQLYSYTVVDKWTCAWTLHSCKIVH
jgi:hypothetical protein